MLDHVKQSILDRSIYKKHGNFQVWIAFRRFFYSFEILSWSETLSRKGRPIKAIPQAGSYFSPSSQATLQHCCLTGHVLSGVHWGGMNDIKMISRGIGRPLSLAYPRALRWNQTQPYFKNLPPLYLLIDIVTLVIGSVPESQTIKTN